MRLLLVTLACFVSVAAQAQSQGSKPLSKEDQQALQDTQDMLRNRQKVEQYMKTNPAASNADNQVKDLMGPDTGATYDLAADVFGDLVREANGDPAKLMQLVEEAQKNPAKFAERLSPAQRDKLRGLANSVEKRQAQPKAPH